MNTVLLGNIVALIGAAIMVSTGFLKTKKQMLTVQCFQFGVLSASNAILGAFTGITANVIGIARNLFCMKKEFTTPWKIVFIAAQLALLFAFTGTMLRINSILSFWTLLIAHITFNLPYVILNVMPKLQQMDKDLVEAALDLGCTPMQAFTKVVIHEIMPGIISGALIAFTMSIDDFIISYFTAGSGVSTLAMTIYSMTKKPVTPEINALCTIMLAFTAGILLVYSLVKKLRRRSQ